MATDYEIGHGDVVIAAITSCTNTSNPSVLVAAGLVARNARAKGLKVKPWVKTSFAPGSQVVTDYLTRAGLQADLDALGFNLTGYGCTVCIGNSGPLPEPVSEAIYAGDLVAAAVLSGNRNFEGRVHAEVKANYLASPPLVVGLCAGRHHEPRSDDGAAGQGPGRARRVPARHLALVERDRRHHPRLRDARYLRRALQRRIQGRRAVAEDGQGARQPDLRLEHRFHLRAEPAVLRGHPDAAGAGRGHGRCPHPRPVRRLDHHRPHLARPDRSRRTGLPATT